MSSQFDSFENEFNHLLNAINRKTSHLASSFGIGAERMKRLEDAERDVREARLLISKMENAARGSEGAAKQRMQDKKNRLRNYTNDLASLERQLREQRATSGTGVWGNASNSSPAAVDPMVDFDGAKRTQRNQVLATQDLADETRERLRHAIEVSAQSEQVGAGTLSELYGQRQQLEAVGDQIYVIDDNMSKSRRILAGMARRAATSKIVLSVIIILLLGAIGLVIYLRWGR